MMRIVVETESAVLWACICITSGNLSWCYYSVQPFNKQLDTRKIKIFINYYMTNSPSVFNLKLFFHFVFCNDISSRYNFPHFTDSEIKAWRIYSDA